MTAKLFIREGHAKPLWRGHPWVYAQSVLRVEGEVQPGDLVDVVDHRRRFIGRALLSPESQIRARIVERDPQVEIDQPWFRSRLEQALSLRRWLGLPSSQTDCYRLINAEGDGLPGLVIDVYGEAVVVHFSSNGMLRRSPLIYQAITELVHPRVLVERVSGAFAEAESLEPSCRVVHGEESNVLGRELGLVYAIDLLGGQKTGLFLDQRENHAFVATLAPGRDVLDLYCYCGGFALNAARAGARTVVAVDSSARAVATARENARSNGLELEVVESDVSRFLRLRDAESFDVIIVDPPKFAPDRRAVPRALRAYQRLYEQVFRVLRPGGILCASCCSHSIDQDSLERVLAAAAGPRVRLRLVAATRAAKDHPTLPGFAEGAYLKFLVCQIETGFRLNGS